MVPALVCAVLVGALAVLAGLPFALAARREADGPAAVLADALVLGLAVLGLLSTTHGTLGPVATGAALLGAAAVAVALLARRGLPQRWRPARPDAWAVATGAVLALGAALRLRTTYELPWLGDMGGYLNWANEFARTGVLDTTFPPLFPALLALPSALLGAAWTASLVPLFGVALLVALARLTALLGVDRRVRTGVLLLAAVSPHLVWFGTFPASESLQAPLLLALVTVTATALGRTSPAALPGCLAATAALTAALGLNRAQALALVGPAAVVLLLAARRRPLVPLGRASAWAAAVLVGTGVGYVFGITQIPGYYVGWQLESLVPAPVLDAARSLGLLRGPVAVAVVLALAALLAVAGARLGRRQQPAGTGTGVRARALGAALALVAVAAVVLLGAGEVHRGLLRVGALVLAVALLGLLLPRATAGERAAPVLLAGATGVLFLLVHVQRFDEPFEHSIHLYWDRYLVSEVLPVALLLAAVGASALLEDRRRARLRPAALVALGAVAVASLAAWVPRTAQQLEHEAFAGTFAFTRDLAALAPTADPVLWTADVPAGVTGMFPNSVWSFGSALSYTFGRDVVNLPSQDDAFAAEPVVSAADVRAALACSPTGALTVVEWRHAADAAPVAERLAGQGLVLDRRGDAARDVWLLPQSDDPSWRQQGLDATVSTATAAAGTRLPACGAAGATAGTG